MFLEGCGVTSSPLDIIFHTFYIKARETCWNRFSLFLHHLLEGFSPNVPSFFATYCWTKILTDFHILFAFLLFRWTLGDTYSIWDFVWFSYMHLFPKTRNVMRSNSENYGKTYIFASFFFDVHELSASISVSICSTIFDGKMASTMVPN